MANKLGCPYETTPHAYRFAAGSSGTTTWGSTFPGESRAEPSDLPAADHRPEVIRSEADPDIECVRIDVAGEAAEPPPHPPPQDQHPRRGEA